MLKKNAFFIQNRVFFENGKCRSRQRGYELVLFFSQNVERQYLTNIFSYKFDSFSNYFTGVFNFLMGDDEWRRYPHGVTAM